MSGQLVRKLSDGEEMVIEGVVEESIPRSLLDSRERMIEARRLVLDNPPERGPFLHQA